MKPRITICVLFAVIATLFAPLTALCAPVVHTQQHACCAQESQLSSSCCHSQTAPTPALANPVGVPAFAELAPGSIFGESPVFQAAASAVHQLHSSPSILVPATILRT